MKEKLQEYALIAEIIGAVSIIASLLAVAYSITQNTASLQADNDSFLYELQNQRLSDMSNNAELAQIMVKFESGIELTEAEGIQYRTLMARGLNIWEMAYARNREGLMPDEQWITWDTFWSADMPEELTIDMWSRLKHGYRADFVDHVDSVYAQHSQK